MTCFLLAPDKTSHTHPYIHTHRPDKCTWPTTAACVPELLYFIHIFQRMDFLPKYLYLWFCDRFEWNLLSRGLFMGLLQTAGFVFYDLKETEESKHFQYCCLRSVLRPSTCKIRQQYPLFVFNTFILMPWLGCVQLMTLQVELVTLHSLFLALSLCPVLSE